MVQDQKVGDLEIDDQHVWMEADLLVAMVSDHNVQLMAAVLHAMMEIHQHVKMVVIPQGQKVNVHMVIDLKVEDLELDDQYVLMEAGLLVAMVSDHSVLLMAVAQHVMMEIHQHVKMVVSPHHQKGGVQKVKDQRVEDLYVLMGAALHVMVNPRYVLMMEVALYALTIPIQDVMMVVSQHSQKVDNQKASNQKETFL